MNIYDKDERTILANPPITKDAVHEEELMTSNFVRLSWYGKQRVTLPVGAYVVPFSDGVKYTLFDPYSPKQEGHRKYKYEPQFQHPVMWLGRIPFIHLEGDTSTWESATKRFDWTYVGSPLTIAQRLAVYINWLSSVNEEFGEVFGEGWTANVKGDLPASASCSFASVDILSAAAEIASKFECEYYFDFEDKVFRLGVISYDRDGDVAPLVLKSGANVGQFSVTESKEDYHNCFAVFGGTRNMSQVNDGGENVQVNKRLTLNETLYPDSIIDTREDEDEPVLVKQLVYDNIYPKLDLYVYNPRERRCWLRENGDRIEDAHGVLDPTDNKRYKVYSKWYIRLAYLDNGAWTDYLATDDKRIADSPLMIAFTVNGESVRYTSPLAGREFELVFFESTTTETEDNVDGPFSVSAGDYRIEFSQDGNIIIPTTSADGMVPKGDAVPNRDNNRATLYNIVVDDSYKASAQTDLLAEANRTIAKLRSDLNAYSFHSNEITFKNNNPGLYIGRRVVFDDGQDLVGEESYCLTTHIRKLVTRLDKPFSVDITVGNEKRKGSVSTLKEQVQNIIGGGYGNGEGGSSMTEAQFQQLVRNYGRQFFLSKLSDDAAQGEIGFIKGLWVKAKGLFGFTENGDISARDVKASGNASVGGSLSVGDETISNILRSNEYTGDGMLDTGYKLWYEEGRAKLVIDDLVARGKFTVNELEARKWTYAGGNMVFSGAGSTLFFVEYLDANENTLGYTNINAPWLLAGRPLLSAMVAWSKRRLVQRSLTDEEKAAVVKFRCYEYSDDGTMQTRNWWHVNDLALCQTLNKVKDKVNSDGSYSGYASNTVYHRRVAGIGSKKIAAMGDDRVYDYVDLWNIYDVQGQTYIDAQGQEKTITDDVKGFLNMAPTGQAPSTDWPAAGDVIVQVGNPLDTDRQGAVTIEVQGDTHGLKVYDTISGYSMENKLWVEIGYDQTTGKAKANVYGDFRFGCRASEEQGGGSYVKYNRTTGQLDIRANVRFTSPTTHTETSLDNFASAVVGDLNSLQSQIDGQIESWFYNYSPVATDSQGVPTSKVPLNVAPYSEWTTDALKIAHLNDTFTNNKTGYCWRFSRNASTNAFEWVIIEDSAVIKALQDAAKAQDTADHKRRVFMCDADNQTPVPPYDAGDLWVNVKYPWATGATYNNEILKCDKPVPREEDGQQITGFNINDWSLSNGYTSKLNTFINNTYAPFVEDISQQVDKKAETFRQASDPSSSWYDASQTPVYDVRAEHVGDIWMDISANGGKKTYIYTDKGTEADPRYVWEEQAVPDEVFDEIDGKAEIFVSKPTAYLERDLWIIESGLADADMPAGCQAGDIVVADNMPQGTTKRTKYVKSDWRKKDRYTDDTKANEVALGLAKEITDRGKAVSDAQTAAAQDATNKVNAASQQLTEAINAVDNAHSTAEGALEDGYIDNDEREALKAVQKSLDAEFTDVTASYSVVYNNSLLNGTTQKTALYNAYTALVSAHDAYDAAFTSFIDAPATTKYEKGDSEGDYTYTPEGAQEAITVNLTTLQTTFNTCASTYQTALESANAKIQDEIKKIADAAVSEITSYRYIANAIDASTVIQGGLMLTSAIFLRQLKEDGDPEKESDYITWAGINGTTPDGDSSIAAWYGGDMEDKQAAGTPDPTVRYAKSLFRMDGSGYLAGGNISWDNSGNATFKGTISAGTTITDYQYLKTALGGDTSGLVLANQIAVKNGNNIMAGMSGVYNAQSPGGGIAGWYGGTKNDRENAPEGTDVSAYAKTLFRMDGTGYVASGNISWNASGDVTIQGTVVEATTKIDTPAIFLNGTDITATLNAILDMFEKDTTTQPGTTLIKAKYSLYSVGDVSALGNSSGGGGGGGGGGASVLYELNDVLPNNDHSAVLDAQAGYVLTCVENGGVLKWKAAPTAPTYVLPQATSGALGGIKIGYSASGKNYAIQLDSDGKAYVNVPWEDHTYTLAGLMGSTAKGGTTQPIYWDGTEFKNTAYTLGKSVPSNAVFTDTTYSAGYGITLSSTTFTLGHRWTAVTKGQKWSRIMHGATQTSVEGCNGILTLRCTRGNVVCNATFLVTSSHSSFGQIVPLSSNNYTPIRLRILVNSTGDFYIEIYDTAQSIASGTTQNWHCTFVSFSDISVTAYTAFTDGSSVPSGYTAQNDFTTTVGDAALAIKNISRSGTTFTATRQNGSTFTFDQQDNNTWRPLGTGASDACAGNDSRLSDSRPASDVYSWAKAATKPSYNLDEVSDGSTRKLSNYLPLSGGTMTGAITCKANQYYGSNAFGIHMNNSDLIGCNSIRFGDNSDDYTEAIMFPNDALTSWDSFRATGGTFWWQYNNGNNLAKLNTNGFYLYSGLMRITNNSRTVDIGAQNSGAIHIYNDNSSPFFFNGDVCSNGVNAYDLGSTTYPWGSLYAAQCYIYGTAPSVHVGTGSSARISLHWSSDNNRGLYDYSGYWVIGANTNTFLMRGNVGIGTTSPSYKLHVSGDIYATGDVTADSDATLKTIMSNVDLRVEQIANAPAVKFTWNDKRDDKVHTGTIAQYWQKILPECINDKSGTLSMNYGAAAMVSVINVAKEVVDHEERIEELERENERLRQELRQLKSA